MHLCLFQPEIPQNLGTLLRLGACTQTKIIVIEPCGFILTDKRLKRSGMDYIEHAMLEKVSSWENFKNQYADHRIIALEPEAQTSYLDFSFQESDVLLLGKESSGLPKEILRKVDSQIRIPMVR